MIEKEHNFDGNLAVEMTGLPALSEIEYYLLAEIINMPNRKVSRSHCIYVETSVCPRQALVVNSRWFNHYRDLITKTIN